MSAFKSPYDREFELQAQEEHKAYQRGFNAGRKSVLDKIREEIKVMTSNRGFLSCSVGYIHEEIDNVFDKYKTEIEPQESEEPWQNYFYP